MVVDGIEGKGYDYIITTPVFSPDGKRTAYWAINGSKWVIVIDGKEEKESDPLMKDVRNEIYRILAEQLLSPVFSNDGSKIAYAVKNGAKNFVVINGKEYDGMPPIVFSFEGQHLAYLAFKDNKTAMVLDGVKSDIQYDKILWDSIRFSSDNHLAYLAIRGNKPIVVLDGIEGKEYDEVKLIVFSPNGKRLACWARRGNKWFTVIDGVEGKEYDGYGDIVFSPDSRRVYYRAEIGDEKIAVISEKTYSIERGGKTFPIKRDELEMDYNNGKWPPAFSSNGKKMAYWGIVDVKYAIFVDNEKTGKEYDNEYIAKANKIIFDGSDTFHTLAIQGDDILLLEGKIMKSE